MKRTPFLALLLVLSACSHGLAGKSAERAPRPVLERGWAYAEPESEALKLDAGEVPVSYSAPVVAGEKVVYGSDRFGLTVLGKRSGALLWRKTFTEPVAAQPLVQGDHVFVGSGAGDLHKLDLETGSEAWAADLGAPVHGSFLYAFDRLFVATVDEALHAVDPATGKVLWTYRRPLFGGTSIRGGGNPAAVGGKVWMGFSDGALVSLDPQGGTLESEKIYRDNVKFTDVDARVIGYRDGILATTYDGKLRFLNKDGSLGWEFPAGGARTPLLAEGGTVYLPSSDGTVYAVNADTGKEIWRHAFRRGVPTSVALAGEGKKRGLVVTSSDERVFLLNPVTGEALASNSLGRGSGSYAPVALDEGGRTFYVLSNFSRLYQFRVN